MLFFYRTADLQEYLSMYFIFMNESFDKALRSRGTSLELPERRKNELPERDRDIMSWELEK